MLKSLSYANREVATQYGKVKFDENGESRDLTKEQEEVIGSLRGFSRHPDEGETVEDPKDENPEEEKIDDTDEYDKYLEGNIQQVKEKTDGISPKVANELIYREQAGHNRKGVISHLEDALLREETNE